MPCESPFPGICRWYVEYIRDDREEAIQFANAYIDYLAGDLKDGILSPQEFHMLHNQGDNER